MFFSQPPASGATATAGTGAATRSPQTEMDLVFSIGPRRASVFAVPVSQQSQQQPRYYANQHQVLQQPAYSPAYPTTSPRQSAFRGDGQGRKYNHVAVPTSQPLSYAPQRDLQSSPRASSSTSGTQGPRRSSRSPSRHSGPKAATSARETALPKLLSHLSLENTFALPSTSTSDASASARQFSFLPSASSSTSLYDLDAPGIPASEVYSLAKRRRAASTSVIGTLRKAAQAEQEAEFERTKKRKIRHRFFRSDRVLAGPSTSTPATAARAHPTAIGQRKLGERPIARRSFSSPSALASPFPLAASASPATPKKRGPLQRQQSPKWLTTARRTFSEGTASRMGPGEEEWVGDAGNWVGSFPGAMGGSWFGYSMAEEQEGEFLEDLPEHEDEMEESEGSDGAARKRRAWGWGRRRRSASTPAQFVSVHSHAAESAQAHSGTAVAPPLPSTEEPDSQQEQEEAEATVAALKKHLLAVLRGKSSGEGHKVVEAGLKLKKWVLWNAWTRKSQGFDASSSDIGSEDEGEYSSEDEDDGEEGQAYYDLGQHQGVLSFSYSGNHALLDQMEVEGGHDRGSQQRPRHSPSAEELPLMQQRRFSTTSLPSFVHFSASDNSLPEPIPLSPLRSSRPQHHDLVGRCDARPDIVPAYPHTYSQHKAMIAARSSQELHPDNLPPLPPLLQPVARPHGSVPAEENPWGSLEAYVVQDEDDASRNATTLGLFLHEAMLDDRQTPRAPSPARTLSSSSATAKTRRKRGWSSSSASSSHSEDDDAKESRSPTSSPETRKRTPTTTTFNSSSVESNTSTFSSFSIESESSWTDFSSNGELEFLGQDQCV